MTIEWNKERWGTRAGWEADNWRARMRKRSHVKKGRVLGWPSCGPSWLGKPCPCKPLCQVCGQGKHASMHIPHWNAEAVEEGK